jgi:hydrogenase maturation factor HypE
LSFCVDVFVADDSDVAEAFSFISFVDVDILKSVTVRLRDASDDPCVLLLNE